MCIGQEGPRVEAKCRIKEVKAGRGCVSKIAARIFCLVTSWPSERMQ